MARITADPTASPNCQLQPLEGGAAPLPRLWLGAWSLGGEGFGPQDGRESLRVLEQAFAGGVRHFDTAGLYAHGRSEALLAKAFRNRRRQVFLSSKGSLEWSGNQVLHRAKPGDLRRHLEASLKRLNTDYLDLFQLHWPDPETPIEESLGALRDLQREGLIRHWGAGNLSAEQITQHIPAGAAVPHQVHFNPIHREDDILTAGAEKQRCLNCVVSPLEQGLLGSSAAATGLAALGKRDLRRRNPHFRDPQVLAWLEGFKDLTKTNTIPRAAMVLAWILAYPDVYAVIPGPRNLRQLHEVLAHRPWLEKLAGESSRGDTQSVRRDKLAEVLGPSLWRHLENGPRGA